MRELLASPFLGITLTAAAYWTGVRIQKRTGLVICNGLLLAALMVIAVLTVFDIPYDSYNAGGSMINMMLGPATACMAVSIYRKWELLKKNVLPIMVGCLPVPLLELSACFCCAGCSVWTIR